MRLPVLAISYISYSYLTGFEVCLPRSRRWYWADSWREFLCTLCTKFLHLLIALIFHYPSLLKICNLFNILVIKLS